MDGGLRNRERPFYLYTRCFTSDQRVLQYGLRPTAALANPYPAR